MFKNINIFIFSIFCSVVSSAGGITLDGTRLVYPIGEKQLTTNIRNTSEKSTFLVQAWVEVESGEKAKKVLVTPPLFTSTPGDENTLRVLLVDDELPLDRESLYYFNVKSIPSINKNEVADKNLLLIASVTRIKMFARPKGLKGSYEKAAQSLKFKKIIKDGGVYLEVKNPSPYFITISNVYFRNKSIGTGMVYPFEKLEIPIDKTVSVNDITYSIINDFGGIVGPRAADVLEDKK